MRGEAAIVAFAELPTRRTYPGRSALGLLADVANQAIEDAHLRKEDVDGLITEGGMVYPAAVAEYMGMTPGFATGVSMMGCSGGTAISIAAAAIHAGLATNVLVAISQFREANTPFGAQGSEPTLGTEFESPYGPAVAANTGYGMMYSRHMHEYGTTPEQMARIAANQRFNALENPNSAFQGQPITVEDVLASRYINWPLHLLECVMPCAGGAAVIVTSADRAKSFPNRPVYLLGAGVGVMGLMGWQHDRITESPVAMSAPRAFAMSGYGPKDVQFAQFYD